MERERLLQSQTAARLLPSSDGWPNHNHEIEETERWLGVDSNLGLWPCE